MKWPELQGRRTIAIRGGEVPHLVAQDANVYKHTHPCTRNQKSTISINLPN